MSRSSTCSGSSSPPDPQRGQPTQAEPPRKGSPPAEPPRNGSPTEEPPPKGLPQGERPRGGATLAVLRLLRITNLPSPIADQIAAAAVLTDGNPPWRIVLLAGAASACLYHGGMALNDFADRRRDARDRPERPIPLGQIQPHAACGIGAGLLILGVALATIASPGCGWLATGLAAGILAYDFAPRRGPLVSPVLMGACRATNWLLVPTALGTGAGLAALEKVLVLASLYGAWVAVLTSLARREATGSSLRFATGHVQLLGGLPLLSLPLVRHPLVALPYLLLLAGGLEWARRSPATPLAGEPGQAAGTRRASASRIREAVGWAVRGTILFDAALAAGSGAGGTALALLGIFLAARPLARVLPVT